MSEECDGFTRLGKKGVFIFLVLPDGRSVGYQYDANGNLTAITPPGREAHVFSYTNIDLEESYTPPDIEGALTVTAYEYRKNGDVFVFIV